MPAPKQRKMAVVGSRSVGKSSLTVRLCEGYFVDSYYPTIENTFSKVIRHRNNDFATEIVDTAGTDEYSILSSKHFIGIHGYVLVYSIASRQSFEQVKILRDKILNHLGTDWVPLVIVGNKCDLKPDQRCVTTAEGQQLAEEYKCSFTEASARLDINVGLAFERMIGEIEKSQNPEQPTGGNKLRPEDLKTLLEPYHKRFVEIASKSQGKNTLKALVSNRFTPIRNPLDAQLRGIPRDPLNMLDVLDFIEAKGGEPTKVKESQRRRYAPEGVVEEIQSLYEDARRTRYAASQVKQKINVVQKEIQTKRKAKENADDILQRKAELEKEMRGLEASAIPKDIALQKKLKTIGNYVHESVPVSDNEDNNALVRSWTPEGVTLKRTECLSHHEILARIDGYDPERAQKIVGHRGYCLTGYGLFLNDALANYGKQFLHQRGYKAIQPPYFMFREHMAKTAQLEQFDEELYKVVEDENNKDSDKYLIATSEQPISALHAGEWMQKKDLPIKYAGFSTCFRKEAGAHGKDAWGIFRVHQFEKIEQFLFTEPEKSWEAFDDMIAISEAFYKSLGLPYQVVAIVSGALNNAAAKKYDLEAWFPYQSEFKELVSCSNCTDYQARALEIRYGAKQITEARKKYVHALNSTLCATERALCCVLENYQTEDGVRVPDVLRKWMPDEIDFIPYTKELPKDSTSTKSKGRAPGSQPRFPSSVDKAVDKMEKVELDG
ncbi:MAG: hypothetical protein Q9163_001963 [Psora crenata]